MIGLVTCGADYAVFGLLFVHAQIKAGHEVTKKIEELQVDGDLLLLLTEKNLQLDLDVNNAITRKRFRLYCLLLLLTSYSASAAI